MEVAGAQRRRKGGAMDVGSLNFFLIKSLRLPVLPVMLHRTIKPFFRCWPGVFFRESQCSSWLGRDLRPKAAVGGVDLPNGESLDVRVV